MFWIHCSEYKRFWVENTVLVDDLSDNFQDSKGKCLQDYIVQKYIECNNVQHKIMFL